MDIAPDKSSVWMIDFQKQLVRGKHVLLYGNIADQFLLNGAYCSLQQFLDNYLVEEGYEIVGTYDIVDGFRFVDPGMQSQFRQLVESRLGGADGGSHLPDGRRQTPPERQQQSEKTSTFASTAGESPSGRSDRAPTPREGLPSQSAGGPPRRGVPSAGGGRSASPDAAGSGVFAPSGSESGANSASKATESENQAVGALRDPQQALAAIRIVLSQSQRSTGMIVAFSDKLVSNPEHHDQQERLALVQLMKILQEAAYLPSGALAGRKNVVVIVAGQLGAVPEWLHKDNPFLELIKVSRPRQDDRKMFVRSFLRHFHEGAGLSPEQVDEVVQTFANLTDGFTAWDLEAIRRTSIADRIPVGRTKALIDYYKYGLREDPWEKLDPGRIQRAHQALEQRVIGQSAALHAVETMLMSAQVGVTMTGVSSGAGRPKGMFFFVGPTGVGKTELAKALTELIFSDESAFARFDMSEYAEKHAAEKLTGAPPGFVGYEEGGLLTNRVRERPFSLLLFDEIEKADGSIMDKFLQILEDGRFTDGKGQTAYFSQTVIIFTSNIGSDTIKQQFGENGELPDYGTVVAHYRSAVADHFSRQLRRPELLNRLGENILVFDLLRPEYIAGIYRKFMNMLASSVREKLHADLAFPDSSVEDMIVGAMQSGDNLMFGGRRVKSLLEELVERPLNRWLFSHQTSSGQITLTADPSRKSILVNNEPVPY